MTVEPESDTPDPAPGPAAAGDHQAVRLAGRQRRHRPRHPARGDPLPAGRERRRQVDADERALRAAAARRGRDHHRRRGRTRSRNPKEAMAAGIGMVHQHFMLVEVFTVAENLILGRERHRPGARHAPGPRDGPGAVGPLQAVASTRTRWSRTCRSASSSGSRSSRRWPTTPRYLIFDEPTAVLTPQEIDELIDRHAVAAGRGQGHRLHHPQAARGARDRRQDHRHPPGQGRRHGRAGRLRGRAGRADGRPCGQPVGGQGAAAAGEAPRLVLEGVSVANPPGAVVVDGLDLEVAGGEIVCIAGVQGNGQTELAEALLGLIPICRARSPSTARRSPSHPEADHRRRPGLRARGPPARRLRRHASPSPRTWC